MTTIEPTDQELPLVEHLREFRNRLIYCLIALTITMGLSMFFAEQILIVLVSPLAAKPVALDPTDTIIQWFRVAFVTGLAMAMPVVLYHIIAFLLPALTQREKRYLFIFIPFATLLFIAGIAFAAIVVVPSSLNFLQAFGISFAINQYRLDSYISFITTFCLALGLGFQTPLVIFTLAKLGIVSYPFLIKNIRWAVLIASVLSAIITPTPDPWNMALVLIPLLFLYFLGVFLAKFA